MPFAAAAVAVEILYIRKGKMCIKLPASVHKRRVRDERLWPQQNNKCTVVDETRR